jgi:hypothetical protein
MGEVTRVKSAFSLLFKGTRIEAAVPPRKPLTKLPAVWSTSAVCLAMIAGLAAAQENRTITLKELCLPSGPVTRLSSPDGSRILYGVPYQSGTNDGPRLWIEDTRTHQRKMLLSIGSTLSAVWSPDGTSFSVQDHWASDSARSYIYDADTLQRLDLGRRILTVDQSGERFADGHAYFDFERWEDAQQVIVHFHGHTDQPPVVCFDFQYRVSRSGAVVKLSQRVFPINNQTFCTAR